MALPDTGPLSALITTPPPASPSELAENVRAVRASLESSIRMLELGHKEQAGAALGRARVLMDHLGLPPHARARRVLDGVFQEVAAARNERDLRRAARALERTRELSL